MENISIKNTLIMLVVALSCISMAAGPVFAQPDIMDSNYNMTGFINSSSIGELFVNSNALAGGYYIGYLIIVSLFVVTFISIQRTGHNSRNAATGASFLTMLVALLLRGMTMLDNYAMYWVVFLFVIVVFVSYLMKDSA